MISRDLLILKYREEHRKRMETGLNTDLKPGDSVGWFTRPTNTRATWRGKIERIWTPVLIENGVIGFEPKADFKAPSWNGPFPITVSELRKK